MSNKHLSTKFKKILILGVAIAGIFFLNKRLIYNQSDPGSGFAIQPLSKGFSLAKSGVHYEFYKDKLKSYPEPSEFKSFEYPELSRQNGGSYGAGKNSDLEFNGECSDLYYTILIYSKEIDYRANPASARFNQAFVCPTNRRFKFTVDQGIGLSEGEYYIIFADQGQESTWYNPR